MDRYAYLATLSNQTPLVIGAALLLLAVLVGSMRRWFGLDSALFVPVYYPIAVVLLTVAVLLQAGFLAADTTLYVLLVSLGYGVCATRLYANRIKPLFQQALQIWSSGGLQSFALAYSGAYLVVAVALQGAVAGGESRISFLFTSALFRFVTPVLSLLSLLMIPLSALTLLKRAYGVTAGLFATSLLVSYLGQSKGAALIGMVSTVLLAMSVGEIAVSDLLARLPIRQKSRPLLLALLLVAVAVFVALCVVYAAAMNLSFVVIGERVLQNADAVFMYFPDAPAVALSICAPLGPIAPLHRGLGALLGQEAAADPNTIFGIALNALYADLPFTKLEGPNALLPAWSHCYYGWLGGLLVCAGLLLLLWWLTGLAPRLMATRFSALLCVALIYGALGFFQEVSLLTSLISLLLLVWLLQRLTLLLAARPLR